MLPQSLRREIMVVPGGVMLRRSAEGVLLTPVAPAGGVEQGPDGPPALRLGRRVSNDEVIDAIDRERSGR